MKNKKNTNKFLAMMLTLALMFGAFAGGVLFASETAVAESGAPVSDPSPAIHVAQKTAASVVGVSSYTQTWDRNAGQQDTLYGQGSGVVIAEGGYVLTNYHVIESCSSFEVLMPDGTYVKAKVVGTDNSTDLAVLQVQERADELVPIEIATTADLLVGSTVIAIGNPGGDTLANTVTQGIVSALERNVSASNTSRAIKYVQHDASISSGNSGGGLFNISGQLIGINTLKYSGSVYSNASYEGLGFAIPVDAAYPIAMDLIQYGSVQRPQMGITCTSLTGPDEAMPNYAPTSVIVVTVNENTPAQTAGIMPYDCITEIDGVRITDMVELTTELDKHADGDKVTLTIVRYDNPANVTNLYELFASNSGSSSQQNRQSRSSIFGYGYSDGMANNYETLTIEVELKVPAK